MEVGRSVTVRPTWFRWGIRLVIAPPRPRHPWLVRPTMLWLTNRGGVMEINPAYHVAFLVADIQAGIKDFGAALGLTFRPAQTLTTVTDASGGEKAVLSSYSYEGPTYVQLIEGQEGGVYGLEGGEGFHHFGVW